MIGPGSPGASGPEGHPGPPGRPYAQALATGCALWLLAALTAGRREAWDGPLYWTLAYPLALAACAWLGWRHPQRAWRWPLTLFLAQFLTMVLLQGGPGNLWPLGLLMFGVLALPGIALALWAARWARAGE